MITNPGGSGSKIVGNSLWLWLQQVIDLAFALTLSLVIIRALGPENFGVLSLTQGITNIFGVLFLYIEQSILILIPRQIADNQTNDVWMTWFWAVILKLFQFLLVTALVGALAVPLSLLFHIPGIDNLLLIGCLSILGSTFADLGGALVLSISKTNIRPVITLVRRGIELVSVVGLWYLGAISLDLVFFTLACVDCIAGFLYTMVSIIQLAKLPKSLEIPGSRPVIIMEMIKYAIPLNGARVTDILGREAGKLILGRFSTAELLGYYGVVRLIADRLTTFLSQITVAAVPVMAPGSIKDSSLPVLWEISSKHDTLFRYLVRYQLILATITGVTVYTFAPVILTILGGESYLQMTERMFFVGANVILWGAVAIQHAPFLISGKTIGILILNTSQILASFSLYLLFVPGHQVSGVISADAFALLVPLSIGLILNSKWHGIAGGKILIDVIGICIPAAIGLILIYLINYGVVMDIIGLVFFLGLFGIYLMITCIIYPADWLWFDRRNIKVSKFIRFLPRWSTTISNWQDQQRTKLKLDYFYLERK